MGFLGLFRSKSFHPEEFEQQLTALTQAISQNREQIAALTSKQRAWRRSLCLYCIIIYISFVAFRYKASYTNLGVLAIGKSRLSVFVSGQSNRDLAAIVFSPFTIALVVYVVNALFGILIHNKDRHLKSLLKKHKAKLEELKQVTNFSRTNQILEKFDSKPVSENASQKPVKRDQKSADNLKLLNLQGKTPDATRNSQQKKLPPTVNLPKSFNSEPAQKGSTKKAVNPGAGPVNPVQPAPTRLTLQDRLLDFIIGSDHNENVENRYALICANCYTHNGLAPPGCQNPVSVTYICRHCGYINGELSALHRKSGQATPCDVPKPEMISKEGTDEIASNNDNERGTKGGREPTEAISDTAKHEAK
ncbi:hypothetical protein OXX59_005144 [Metschnikowia pulcherrima]